MTSTQSVIKCESVYKIFGANAKAMLENASGNVDAKTFQEAGYIVGVNNASFDVSKGELLVIMGFCTIATQNCIRKHRFSIANKRPQNSRLYLKGNGYG